ncbi:MAG: hypothetical protein AAF605_04800 [Myxococcota bacterium]
MTEKLSKDSNDFFAGGALVGKPVEDAGMARADIDGLDFSTARSKRPEGLSREEYIRSRPGRHTMLDLENAGIEKRRTTRNLLMALVLGALVIGGVALVIVST